MVARFLSVVEFKSSEDAMASLLAEGRTVRDQSREYHRLSFRLLSTFTAAGQVWATDLSQGAVVLAPGAAWLGDTPHSLPEKLAIVIGTESTGCRCVLAVTITTTCIVPCDTVKPIF